MVPLEWAEREGQSGRPTRLGGGRLKAWVGWGGALPALTFSKAMRGVRPYTPLHCELGAHTLHLLGGQRLSQQSRPPRDAPGPRPRWRPAHREVSSRMDFICSQAAQSCFLPVDLTMPSTSSEPGQEERLRGPGQHRPGAKIRQGPRTGVPKWGLQVRPSATACQH